MRFYLIKEELAQNPLNTATDILALEKLCNALGITGGLYECVTALKKAFDAYVNAFEEELKALDDLRNKGLISEKEYLDRLRVLYERYFKDKLGYEKEFAKYQKQYLDNYKSLYESIFSHATKLISDRIDLIEDEKDKAIDALEEQKKAAEDSYNAQRKLLTIKEEMIKKLGNGAEAVRLVTDAINGQVEAFDALIKKQWEEAVDNFNFNPDRKWTYHT